MSDIDQTILERALRSRVVITTAAADVLRRVREQHGRVMFHQSGGCCEGSGPACFKEGSYIVSPLDRLLGVVGDGPDDADGTPVWISSTQFAAWQHTQVVIDATEGMGLGGFSLEGPLGSVFLSRARVFSADELAALPPAPTKAQVDKVLAAGANANGVAEVTAGDAPPLTPGAPTPDDVRAALRPLPPVNLEGAFGTACGMPTL